MSCPICLNPAIELHIAPAEQLCDRHLKELADRAATMDEHHRLDHILKKALCIGPLDGVVNRIVRHMLDYLAHHFAQAALTSKDPESIRELWRKISGEIPSDTQRKE